MGRDKKRKNFLADGTRASGRQNEQVRGTRERRTRYQVRDIRRSATHTTTATIIRVIHVDNINSRILAMRSCSFLFTVIPVVPVLNTSTRCERERSSWYVHSPLLSFTKATPGTIKREIRFVSRMGLL